MPKVGKYLCTERLSVYNFHMKGKKYGGRTKGTPNKITNTMREDIMNLLRDYQDSGKMSEDWGKLDARERLAMAEKLMQYAVPKLQSIEMSGETSQNLTIEDKLVKLSEEES